MMTQKEKLERVLEFLIAEKYGEAKRLFRVYLKEHRKMLYGVD